jgi:hypothetical protein
MEILSAIFFYFLDCETEPDISRHSTLEECKDKRYNEIRGNRLRLEDREIFFKSDKIYQNLQINHP